MAEALKEFGLNDKRQVNIGSLIIRICNKRDDGDTVGRRNCLVHERKFPGRADT